jgi:hypothetical protein
VDADLLSAVAFMALLLTGAVILGLLLAEALGRRHDSLRRRRGRAEDRALALLREWLSPAQVAQFKSYRHFDVIGSTSGRRYRIRPEPQMNVDELDASGARVAVWCFLPEGHLPIADIMLAQKIALETDERAALAVAHGRAG